MVRYKIVLDPGHGGRDPGAVGPGGTKEKDVNLAVVKLLAKELSYFARVLFAREHDEYRELWERSSLGPICLLACIVMPPMIPSRMARKRWFTSSVAKRRNWPGGCKPG